MYNNNLECFHLHLLSSSGCKNPREGCQVSGECCSGVCFPFTFGGINICAKYGCSLHTVLTELTYD